MSPGLPAPAAALRQVRDLLARHSGLALDARHDETLRDALVDVAARLGLAGPDDALAMCERDPTTLAALVACLRVGETHFFRDRAQHQAIECVALPAIFEDRADRRSVRLWSAGCATGEEAHGLAIAAVRSAERAGLALADWDLQVIGTDVDEAALEVARGATFGNYSFRGVSAEERHAWFEPDARGGWRVAARLKDIARFVRHDLVREDVPAVAEGADLVLCRNVLMYLTPEAARFVLCKIVASMAPGGWLVVGAAEHGLVQGVPVERHALPGAILHRKSGAAPRPEEIDPCVSRGSVALVESFVAVALAEPARVPVVSALPEADPLAGAREALERGEFDLAAERALETVESRPDDARSCLFLGTVAADRGRAPEARAWLSRATELSPEDPEGWYLLGLLAHQAGDAEGADRCAARALAADPRCVMALALRARLLSEAGEEARAARVLAEAIAALAALGPGPVPLTRGMPAAQVRSALEAIAASARERGSAR